MILLRKNQLRTLIRVILVQRSDSPRASDGEGASVESAPIPCRSGHLWRTVTGAPRLQAAQTSHIPPELPK